MKLLTLNTHSLVEPDYEAKRETFVDFIAKEQPDVFALQEVNQTAAAPLLGKTPAGYCPCPCNDVLLKADNHAAAVARMLEERGVTIPIHHCSNSAGIVELPEANMNMVRAGITLYGLWPSDEVSRDRIELRPVMSMKSQISFIKTLEKGRSISYGGTYVTDRSQRIATIPVGYADGYARGLSNKGYVLIHGKKAPICGRVCMDQFMVDVTDIPEAVEGDAVTLLGRDGDAQITMEELGELSGRFNYEFACLITPRVPRIYK